MTCPIGRREFIAGLSVIIGCPFQQTIRTASAETDIPQVAFLGFQIINTSIEPTTPEEAKRLRMLDDVIQQRLLASGRFKLIKDRVPTLRTVAMLWNASDLGMTLRFQA